VEIGANMLFSCVSVSVLLLAKTFEEAQAHFLLVILMIYKLGGLNVSNTKKQKDILPPTYSNQNNDSLILVLLHAYDNFKSLKCIGTTPIAYYFHLDS
jgi:hypothetical protein